ncbi:NifB/NifX family molybdenum-iron cluster-binding protein [Sulfobacillus harzensis]|uniref:Dinitrogenase iron-molybdenum cofactor biosynthesis domain-containing protein n=1 Tax=Sulfobacillus harzensis TaxID=2729629 RepID=A0A7Y0L1L5_9FIRM|nr:NifB/NifX family molybdenum-iron cluster-binding protein [Sulfobacillus harzensis]NMP21352.1 hypothetical protein [Sulfobacillus harzensis]
MVICISIQGGQVGGGWGRAHDVAVVEVAENGEIQRWEEYNVRWDELHDQGGEGSHHARIAKFLMDHGVQRVITGHMGPGMQHMLDKMNISVVVDVSGNVRDIAAQYAR